jgi:hypothetical protein
MKAFILALVVMATFGISASAFAHSGGTDKYGCHYDRKTGVIFIVLSADTTGMHTGCRTPEGIRQEVAPLFI